MKNMTNGEKLNILNIDALEQEIAFWKACKAKVSAGMARNPKGWPNCDNRLTEAELDLAIVLGEFKG